jgi:hypothetical protein
MIFQITATHTHASCYAHSEEKRGVFVKTILEAEEKGVNVLSCHVNAGAHKIFMLIESDSLADITAWMGPILPLNDYDMLPVLDMKAAVESIKA